MKLSKMDWIRKYIKLKISYPSFRSIFFALKDDKARRAIVFGTPVHSNLGDHIIAEKSIRLVKQLGYDHVLEIPEFVYELFPNKIQISPKDTIFIVGGGWMGDLYEDELVIEELIEKHLSNRIVVLPQTIQFTDENKALRLKSLLQKAKDVIVCVRENNSLIVCRDILGLDDNNSILLPDMALMGLDDVKEIATRKTNRVIISFRNDNEKLTKDSECRTITSYILSQGYECINSSTVLSEKIVPLRKRTQYIKDKINEFANVDLIVTDRLHSMVFALLAGTKCIAIDNSTHKVSGVYSAWLTNINGLEVVNHAADLTDNLIRKVLCTPAQHIEFHFTKEFDELKIMLSSRE